MIKHANKNHVNSKKVVKTLGTRKRIKLKGKTMNKKR